MKLRLLFLVCGVLLIFAGCSSAGESGKTESENSVRVFEKNEQASQSEQAQSDVAGTKPATVEPVANQPGSAYEDIIAGADSVYVLDDMLLIIPATEAEIYAELGAKANDIYIGDRWSELEKDIFLLVPMKDNLNLRLDVVSFNDKSYELNEIKVLQNLEINTNESYKLEVFITESIPDLRLTVEHGGKMAEWFNQYNGVGDGVSFIGSEPAKLYKIDEFENLISLSAALATSKHILPEWYEDDSAFWQTIAHAITIDTAADYGDTITIGEDEFYEYIEAIFPGMTMWPELVPQIVYDESSASYEIEPCLYGDYTFWEHVYTDVNEDGSGCTMLIELWFPDESADIPVYYNVKWSNASKEYEYEGETFKYYNVGVELLEAMG